MGGSSSKSSSKSSSRKVEINNVDLQMHNESMNEFISNIIIKQASSCSAKTFSTQTIIIKNIEADKDIEIGTISQEQDVLVTFDCVQVSDIKNEIAAGLTDKYVQALQSAFTSDVINEIVNKASNSTESGFGGSIGNKNSSSTDNSLTYENRTNIRYNLRNIVKNKIENNISIKDMQECIKSASAKQTITVAQLRSGGTVKINTISQKQALKLLVKCVQNKGVSNTISSSILKIFDISVANDSRSDIKAYNDNTSDTILKDSGIFKSVGDGIASILGGVSGVLDSALMLPIAMIIGFLVFLFILTHFFKFQISSLFFGSSDKNSDDGFDNNNFNNFNNDNNFNYLGNPNDLATPGNNYVTALSPPPSYSEKDIKPSLL